MVGFSVFMARTAVSYWIVMAEIVRDVHYTARLNHIPQALGRTGVARPVLQLIFNEMVITARWSS